MNHISKSFALSDGRSCRSHSWELREGGYRRLILILGNGLWPSDKDPRMIAFLLDRGFRVLALDLAFGSTSAPRVGLRAYREAVAAFAQASVEPDLPFYVLAESFSAGAFFPIASSIAGLAAVALVAPVVDFPPPRLKRSCFLMPTAELEMRIGDLCGEEALAAALVSEGLMPERAKQRFRKRDLWTLASDLTAALGEGLEVPVAAFSGEDDPFITQEGRQARARSAAKLYAYPRTRHEPGRDRYADNFYADLGTFLGEVESTGFKKRE
jgi:alpha-beta hydrolase superfamily lysophospholipase